MICVQGYTLSLGLGTDTLSLPVGARPLSVGTDSLGAPKLYAKGDTEAEHENVTFLVLESLAEIVSSSASYVGTLQSGPLTYHVFKA